MDQNLRLVTTIEAQIKDDFLTTEGSVLYSNVGCLNTCVFAIVLVSLHREL